MKKLLPLLAALALPAGFAATPAAALARQQRGVDDPQAFVAATYARYQRDPNVPPPDQSFAYSERLGALFTAYDSWSRQHEDLVGALDFDWWTNSQDYSVRNLVLTALEDGPDVRIIIARFDNYTAPEEVRFTFVRAHGRWFLDEASTGRGGDGDGWILSSLLRERP